MLEKSETIGGRFVLSKLALGRVFGAGSSVLQVEDATEHGSVVSARSVIRSINHCVKGIHRVLSRE